MDAVRGGFHERALDAERPVDAVFHMRGFARKALDADPLRFAPAEFGWDQGGTLVAAATRVVSNGGREVQPKR